MSKLVKSYVSVADHFPIDVDWGTAPKELPSNLSESALSAQDDFFVEDELHQRLDELHRQIEAIEQELDERRQLAESAIERMMIEAQAEIDALREQGYTLGRTEGLAQAQAEMVQVKEDAVRRAAELIDAARSDASQWLTQSEPFVVKLAMDIGRKVVMSELSLSPDLVIGVVREAFACIEQSCDAELRVCPDDFEWVTRHRNRWEPASELSIRVNVVPDGSIERGGCFVATSSGAIDVRVETRLESICKELREAIEERHS